MGQSLASRLGDVRGSQVSKSAKVVRADSIRRARADMPKQPGKELLPRSSLHTDLPELRVDMEALNLEGGADRKR